MRIQARLLLSQEIFSLEKKPVMRCRMGGTASRLVPAAAPAVGATAAAVDASVVGGVGDSPAAVVAGVE
jgi:hypothetical protein